MISFSKAPFYINITALLFLSLILSEQLKASEAKLTLSKEFYLVAVNGKSHSINQRQPKSVALKQGSNKVALQYRVVWNDQYNNRITTIVSKVFIASFYLRKKEDFRLTFLKPATYLANVQFSKSPKIGLKNSAGFSLDLTISMPSIQTKVNLVRLTKAYHGLRKSQKPITITSQKRK